MALDINGYNATFKAFTDFAQQRVDAGKGTAIARAAADVATGALASRDIKVATTDSLRGFFKWSRSSDDKAANDATRKLFRDAIIDMFGGESKIPAAVKKAMIMADYDCGKPLTARRILAVKNAIDANGTARARSANIRLETFDDPANKAAMIEKGYSQAELPRLARAAHFYAQVNNCAEFEALDQITTPGSKANRLMQYGGRFLESADNFREGLRLIDSFATWLTETKATLDATGKNFQDGMSKTLLNADNDYFKAEVLRGMEKFIFEELACNPAHNLAEQNPDKLFGMENNAATRFFGRGLGKSYTQTVANIPPAKRAAFYAAVDKAFPLMSDPAVARMPTWQRVEQGHQNITVADRGYVIGRVMKNLDKLQALLDKGQLTEKNFVKTCFPEARHNTVSGVKDLIARWGLEMMGDENRGIESKYPQNLSGPIQTMMQDTGCSIEEAAAAANGGKQPSIPKYVASGTLPLSAFDGTVREARTQLAGDLNRPAGYSMNGQELLPRDSGFHFSFPDGSSLKTNASEEGLAQISAVADKVESLCGDIHREQASSVMMLLSQSGLGSLRSGLLGYGIISNEHSAVNYALSKNETTGTVTIKYSSPAELPFKFEWTASVDVFGNVTSTPMKFEKPVAQLDAKAAGALVDGAVKKLGVNLTKAQKNEAVQLLQANATNMYAKNAQLFAKFTVNLVRGNFDDEQKTAMMAETATSIRLWRDFDFGDSGMASFANAAKDYANFCIRGYMQPEQDRKFEGNISTTMRADSNRATYILNGKTYHKKPADELLPEFKKLFPNQPLKQKAISSWLNQICMTTIMVPSTQNAYDNGVVAHQLPGAGALVNRSLLENFDEQIVDTNNCHIVHDLQISPDGRTATITQSTKVDLCGARSGQDQTIFGQVAFSMRLVVDLSAEIPTVTDFQISQKID